MTEHIVVVGHGMVAHRFVSTLGSRLADADLAVTVIGDEPDPAFDRVGLSSYVGAWDREALHLDDARHTADPRVTVRSGHLVTAIDRPAQQVELENGERIGYDTLVLATGSRAFVPPVPGHDLPGCHVYRTLDLDAIRAAAEQPGPGAHGVVIGGGLLGLEAANALSLLGLRPHVVERNDRLMPVQVDTGGGAVLVSLIRGRGIDVHLRVIGTEITPGGDGGAALTVGLTDDDGETTTVDAALVVFSAGIRPRDELARISGLQTTERGGVLTDRSCRTSDPHVYAIGECAAIEGTCYGLVGPGYSSTELVAQRVAGGTAEFGGADLATKLELLRVNVASFGDDLREAICGGACDVAALKACTRAGSSCGSCVLLLTQVLEAEGVEQSMALCEHFDQSRSELFEIVTVTGIRTFSGLVERSAAAPAATSASPRSPRSSPRPARTTSSTASRPPCRTPTTTSWPTSRRTAPTRWCRGCRAGR